MNLKTSDDLNIYYNSFLMVLGKIFIQVEEF